MSEVTLQRALDQIGKFPATRYQGSKRKLLPFVANALAHLSFESCLDLFSGTASVSYLFKSLGKKVTSNDVLACNQIMARALIQNDTESLLPQALHAWLQPQSQQPYQAFIRETFAGIFFTDEENDWLDVVAQNLLRVPEGTDRDLAYFALFQACLAKRPYNLFHRANLYMRTAQVERRFGNKATWERSFEAHMADALKAASEAIFGNGHKHTALCQEAATVAPGFDLVYLDPPYVNARKAGIDYADFYHFLEGLLAYNQWGDRLNARFKHKPLRHTRSPFSDAKKNLAALSELVDIHRASILVLSYRDNGSPTVQELVALLQRHGRKDARAQFIDHKYVLSRQAGQEVLLISEPA